MYVVARAEVCNPTLGHNIGHVCFVAEPITEDRVKIIKNEYIGDGTTGIDLDQTETGISIFQLQEVRNSNGTLVCYLQIASITRCDSKDEAEKMYLLMVGLNHKKSAN